MDHRRILDEMIRARLSCAVDRESHVSHWLPNKGNLFYNIGLETKREGAGP